MRAESHPPYDAKAIANILLDWADGQNIPITPMKLQKLLYFCHSDFLTLTRTPLLLQDFEAWDYGPVIPCIYAEFKDFSKSPITKRAFKFDPVRAERTPATCSVANADLDIIREHFEFYKRASASSLSDLSHAKQGPWDIARRMFDAGRNPDRRISTDMINSYHRPQRPS